MSLKGDKYETTEEVKSRVENTVVLYDGAPVYITQVAFPEGGEDGKEIARVFFQPLPYTAKVDRFGAVIGGAGAAVKPVRKFLSSKKFDLAPFKMGYINYKGQALFLSRAPVRQYRQGLTNNTLIVSDVRGKGFGGAAFQNLIADQAFVDMVAGKYPSFKEAGDMLGQKGVESIAISRMFAFVIDHDFDALYLNHKGIKCGLALKGDKALKVPEKYNFLREEMEDCRIPIA